MIAIRSPTFRSWLSAYGSVMMAPSSPSWATVSADPSVHSNLWKWPIVAGSMPPIMPSSPSMSASPWRMLEASSTPGEEASVLSASAEYVAPFEPART